MSKRKLKNIHGFLQWHLKKGFFLAAKWKKTGGGRAHPRNKKITTISNESEQFREFLAETKHGHRFL